MANVNDDGPSLEQTAAGWDTAAQDYEDSVEHITSRFIGGMLDSVAISAETKLLDIATGTGAVALAAAGRSLGRCG